MQTIIAILMLLVVGCVPDPVLALQITGTMTGDYDNTTLSVYAVRPGWVCEKVDETKVCICGRYRFDNLDNDTRYFIVPGNVNENLDFTPSELLITPVTHEPDLSNFNNLQNMDLVNRVKCNVVSGGV